VRERDLLGIANQYGELDLGAYERQFACAGAVCNGFDVD
jgi:hypothetical protein